MRHIPRAAPLTLAVLACATWAAAQTPVGAEFQVNTDTAGAQKVPRIAIDGSARFTVVWQDGGSGRIESQRYNADGTTQGVEFEISTGSNNLSPDIASDPSGNMAVVWSDDFDGEFSGIRSRRLSSSGQLADPVRVNSYTPGSQMEPAIAVASDGSALVAWSLPGHPLKTIRARLLGAGGQVAGSEFTVPLNTFDGLRNPAVAYLPGPKLYVVTWSNQGLPHRIRRRMVNPATQAPVGSEFEVSSGTNGSQSNPSVASDANGNFVVVWAEASPGSLKLRRFSASGTEIGADFQIPINSPAAPPRIAMSPQGEFVVAWGSAEVNAIRFDASGAPIGSEFQLNSYATGQQSTPAVAMAGTGDFVATWESNGQDGSQEGIYAQRYGTLRGVGLEADTPGNGVWDRNEQNAVVRPTWLNLTGSLQNRTATLSLLTCPAGFSCSIDPPATATYSLPANGKSGCSSCYQVDDTVTGSVPNLHNDATALETLGSGEAKTWKLHIGGSFTDVTTASPYYRSVETLLHRGITGGCTGTTYCPNNTVTREQLPIFLLVAKEGMGYAPPACGTPMFADVPASSPFCRWIEELARRGVVTGCGGGNYCPGSNVSREQIALFALKTFDPSLTPLTLPPCVTPPFTDVPTGSPFCQWIQEAVSRGIIGGCGGGNYCPGTAVIRGDMAVALTVTFGLLLYGP